MTLKSHTENVTTPVLIPAHGVELRGDLAMPEHAKGLIIFAHGSGSSRLSPRNQFVARSLYDAGLATLLIRFACTGREANRSGQWSSSL